MFRIILNKMIAENRLGEMVTIPGGSFLMGNNGHEGFGVPEEFPQHSVYLPTYEIGKYEVTRGQYRKFIEAGQAKSYPGNPKPFDHIGYHFVRGGCWDDGPLNVRCAYCGWYLPPGSGGVGPGDSDYIGFRVAR